MRHKPVDRETHPFTRGVITGLQIARDEIENDKDYRKIDDLLRRAERGDLDITQGR